MQLNYFCNNPCLNIVPNPASGQALVVIDGLKEDASGIQIRIYDMTGNQKYAAGCSSNRILVPLKDFMPGLYPVVVTLENQGRVTVVKGKIMVAY